MIPRRLKGFFVVWWRIWQSGAGQRFGPRFYWTFVIWRRFSYGKLFRS